MRKIRRDKNKERNNWEAVAVASDVQKILLILTDYVSQVILTDDSVVVKVGNTANKQAGIVNVSRHRKVGNNIVQDKLLAVRLAYRLHKYLKSTRKG